MQRLKQAYWDLRASKGKSLLWFYRSVIAEVKVRIFFLKTKNRSDKRHNLPNGLILSLTSYRPRFTKLHLTIMSLISQDMRPDKLILWVAEEDYAFLPEKVLRLTKFDIFDIKTCHDYGPGTKIIPALSFYPNDFIVTADDDLYYPRHWLRMLTREWNGDFKTIFAHRVHEITLKNENEFNDYADWTFDIKHNKAHELNFATGVGGVLYPPNALDKRVLDTKTYLEICHKADDVWLYWMARLGGSCVVNTQWPFAATTWLGSQKVGLVTDNLIQGRNDLYIKQMNKKFGLPQSVKRET
jgi:hypothetical protein